MRRKWNFFSVVGFAGMHDVTGLELQDLMHGYAGDPPPDPAKEL